MRMERKKKFWTDDFLILCGSDGEKKRVRTCPFELAHRKLLRYNIRFLLESFLFCF